jgi:Gluconate 2-dehydrogenase subunit 3
VSQTSRRDVLQGLLAGVGASSAIPALAEAHPMQAHAKDHAKLAEAGARVKADPASREFLDAHQLETLISLAETIVPGSTAAQVAPFIDRLLAVDTQDNQRRFLNALGGLEGESIARYAHPWRGLTTDQQVALLTAASTAPPSPKDVSAVGATPEAPTPLLTLRDRFDHLKGWIVGAYYSSEIGMRELGWTGNTFFASFPGCEHPDGHK